MERRLAAVMAADVVGYSRLIRADEEGTLTALKALHANIIDPKLKTHNGRIVKLIGDGLLAEFGSVVDAVRCAVDVQHALSEHNFPLPTEHRIDFRIGINLGDIVIDGDDIQGDGVNVAARLEGLAEPGGICVSAGVYEQVRDRLDLVFEDLGAKTVKNIERPVHVYGVRADWVAGAAATTKPLQERPSIAVLPFVNMSGDPEQEYLADGIAEDILTGLSRVRWLIVTSRNSSFSYKNKNIDIKRIASELGVRYVVEGSVRMAGLRTRITAQLIDASNDRHIWAERYDRSVEDIFDLQDEITATILGRIEPELGMAEQERARREPPESLDAWDLYLRGQWHLYRFRADDNAEAQKCFRGAIEIDPSFAAAYTGLAYTCHLAAIENFSDDPEVTIAAGIEAARRAVALDDKDAMAFSVLARILTMGREYEAAITAGRMAVDLNPTNAQVRFGYAFALMFSGHLEEAIRELDDAIRLSPRDPNIWSFMTVRSWALCALGHFQEAADFARRASEQPRSLLWPKLIIASSLGHLGKAKEAAKALAEFRNQYPNADLEKLCMRLPFKDRAHAEIFVNGIQKAVTN